jgi:superfamily I DNA and/or RNA helicase
MDLKIKLSYNRNKDDKKLQEWYEKLLTTDKTILAKFSTKSLDIELDRKDNRNIRSLRKVEIAIGLTHGYLILKGHLSCSFNSPFGGEFYIIDYREIPNGVYETLGGVELVLTIDNNYPTDIGQMFNFLSNLASNPDFVFNIGQFDEFMEVFKFYKQLSDEINNSATYEILRTSQPYYYLPVDTKDLYDQNGDLITAYSNLDYIYDKEDLIKGYQIPVYIYERFNNDLKDKTLSLVDLIIKNDSGTLRKIQKMSENLFISNFKVVTEQNTRNIRQIELVNISQNKDDLVISVIEENKVIEKYLNLYDMGQKIKIESIENSLKLINQGTTGASMKMIEYLIGDEDMPSNTNIIKDIDNFIMSQIKYDQVKIKYIKDLNKSQKLAFLKAIDGSPVTLIKGPPGTGKTHVINAITQYITKELNEKVVISSQTHVAIDNVLDKLMENFDLIIPNRITNRRNKYSIDEIDKTLYKTWGLKLSDNLTKLNNQKVVDKIIEDLKKFKGLEEIQYSKNMKEDFSVIGATTTTSAIAGKKGIELLKDYKWLIIDEVSKSPITEVLRYLPYVEKIILVGDDFQLSPLLEFSKEDVKHLPSYDEDMFDKLETIYENSVFSKTINKAQKSGRLILLDENYRSLKSVLDSYNIFYDGNLKNKRESINPEVIQFNEKSLLKNDKNVFFVEVLGGTEQDDPKSHSRYNIQEARATAHFLEDILKNVKNPKTVTAAAIFPYAAQIAYFTKEFKDLINRAKKTLKSFELDTVDAFQGRETDIVLVNTVVTRLDKRNFLRDFRRINVSMSRARDKLVVFGSRSLERIEMDTPDGGKRQYFRDIISSILRNSKMKIEFRQEGEVRISEINSSSTFA